MNRSRILVVDDEESLGWALKRALSRRGHEVAVVATAEDALDRAERFSPEVCLLDIRLPGADGLSILPRLRTGAAAPPVIVMTAFGSLSTAVRAIENGAFDYLVKPFELDVMLATVDRALASRSVPASQADEQTAEAELIGQCPAMQDVYRRLALAAPKDISVLITGASGTGKELVARAIHRHSARRERPFIPVHVAALNPGLIESELFGHVRGAFTGASEDRVGLFRLADGGTIFLDEVAEIPLSAQVKLLRVLESGEVYPVGSGEPVWTNVRVVAATHANLESRVTEGTFREDLFYRLRVFPIHLPRLSERGDDVMVLAEHFRRLFDPESPPLSDETRAALLERQWPGNVRELRNAIEHAAILARGGQLRPEHLPPPPFAPVASTIATAIGDWLAARINDQVPVPKELHAALLEEVEGSLLREVLRRVQGNRVRAAQWLGLNRATIRRMIARYRLEAAPEPDPLDEEP